MQGTATKSLDYSDHSSFQYLTHSSIICYPRKSSGGLRYTPCPYIKIATASWNKHYDIYITRKAK